MSAKFADPQLQLLFDSLKSEIESAVEPLKSDIDHLRRDVTVMSNSINRLHEKVDSRDVYIQGFMEDTRNRLNVLERKIA